jgi:hypothetical protein
MLSMTLASLGWGCWWAALFAAKFLELTPDTRWVATGAALFAVPGLLVAVVTMRAQKAWLYFAAVPLLANLGLLLLPLVVPSNLFARGL